MKANSRLLLLLLLFSFTYVQAQNRPIYLSSGIIQTEANINQPVLDSFNQHSLRFNQKTFAVMQFVSLPTAASRKILSAAGIELQEYLPDNAYTVVISNRLQLASLQQAGVISLLQLSPQQKMEARLKTNIPLWASKVAGTVDLWISYPQAYTQEEVFEGLRSHNIELLPIRMNIGRVVSLRIALNRVEELAALPFVEYVQLAPRGDQTLNFNSRAASRANVLNASIANGGKSLKGEGVVIGVGDNADVQTHIDFSGRLINRAAMPASGHGHHVTGTVAGAGNGNDFFRGYAPKSTIVSQAFNGILQNAAAYVNDYGMVITNNSYGDNVDCDYHGSYDLYSRWMDQMAFDLPYLQNVFASGNSGASSCFPFQPGYHTVLGGYQSAKNVITVGATTDSGAIAGFSSKGPVRDGRTKPEITAMGQQVASAWPTSYYSYNNGTSMASPAVAGGAALLYQRYRQLNAGQNPKNALIKAILCNGASDRGNNGPDYQYGFGWMNLLRSVDMIENNRYLSGNSTNGGSNNHVINIPANTSQLKVLLYWNDPAASPLSAKTLVNDLDLEVINGSVTTLPKVLDTSNAGLNNASIEAADHLNNMEQVIINNPAAGNYTVKIKGTAITQNSLQEYFVVYDFIPAQQLKVTSPAGGETWIPSTSALSRMKISWEAYGFTSGTAMIELSLDNGGSWTKIDSNININRTIYTWYVPNVSTSQALIRISKEGSGESATSQPFSIMPIPVVTFAATTCEGYININWTTVAAATDYEMMILRGDEMQPVATTNSTSYSFGGLSVDSTYWVTVRPRINGIAGRRAVAISRQPIGGSCAGNISDNDLKIEAVISPVTGRKFTATQLSATSQVVVRIKNLDDVPQSNFDLKYSVNGGPWIAETITTPVAAGATYTHTFATTVDLSAVDNYYFSFVVSNNLLDAVTANDTIYRLVKHLENQPLNLSVYFTDNMETGQEVEYVTATTGLAGLGRYDFSPSSVYGRLRAFINSGMAFSGAKALTLDANSYQPSGNSNYLFGTYNLVNYNVNANDLRLDFRYNNHGQQSHVNNRVWIRGSDADPWIEVYDLFMNQDDPGSYKKSSSIELSDILAANGQSFSPSFNVRWGQWGQLPATDKWNASGYSFDDVRVYQVSNDLQMKNIDEPMMASCALGNNTVIKVTVRNSANSTLTNIPVKYRVDNGSWISETIPSIAGNAQVQYSFAATADLSALGTHTIQALVDFSSDSFRENDTLSTTIVNLPVIASYPHLQDFENNNGAWYASGKKSSWEYGTPISNKINGAANGAKAWKTRLAGNYNDNEYSYLYSPCYDISSLSNPTLSFSVALDIEDCGTTLCDGAWVEYSADGLTWIKLGAAGTGTNWYNKTSDQLWSIQNYTNWHVATIPLPTGLNRLRLRFVFKSDVGVNREGIAIDDIHIYDQSMGIYDGLTMTQPVSSVVQGDSWINLTSNGKIIASVKAHNQNLGATDVKAFINTGAVRFTTSQYYHDRNLVLQTNNVNADSVSIRFYFLDKEVDTLLRATGCAGCTKPSSAYRLGVSVYTDPDKSMENGSIGDNNQGVWDFLSSPSVIKVPFDKGYYAEFKTKNIGEFWLNAGGLDGSTPLPVKMMEFTAVKVVPDVLLKWKVGAESNVSRYEIEVARGNDALQAGNWSKIGEVVSTGNSTTTKNYQFTDIENGKIGTRYYRIKTVNADGSFVYSPVRSVVFDDAILWQIYPNPSNGVFNLVYVLNNDETLKLKLVDAKGRTIKQYLRTGNGQVEKLAIDLTLQASGVYLLQVKTVEGTKLFKLYKQ